LKLKGISNYGSPLFILSAKDWLKSMAIIEGSLGLCLGWNGRVKTLSRKEVCRFWKVWRRSGGARNAMPKRAVATP